MTSSRHSDEKEPGVKRICFGCVGESFLKAAILAEGTDAACDYCEDEEVKTFTIEQIADRVEKAFEEHYERTSTNPDGFEAAMLADKESDYEWERHGEEVVWAIANAAEIDEEPAADVLTVLEDRHYDHESAKMGEECPFDKDSYYEEKDASCDVFAERWQLFENGLKTEARYLSRSAQAALDAIFGNIASLTTSDGKPVVVTIGSGSETDSIYRARVFAAEDDKLVSALKFPWREVGPPPMLAAKAGRMNAQGISVFYGANTVEAAIAEVRPPVGSQVVTARFTIIRSLKLLDVAALQSVSSQGSVFDPELLHRLQRAKFMGILGARITRPVMPNEEAFEYLATQVVADYLATEVRLDGIIFPSVQVAGEAANIVLFHHASRVEERQLPEGTEISVHLESYTDEGMYPDYSVIEQTPAEPSPSDVAPHGFGWDRPIPDFTKVDVRAPALAIDIDSITVHHVNAVSFTTQPYSVDRTRVTKQTDSPF